MFGYRPLVYFWIAEYNDGTALPQFDPETGLDNKFSEVQHDKLVRFGWYPFSFGLSQKIFAAEGIVVIPTFNKSHKIEIERGQKVVACRANQIDLRACNGKVERKATVYVLGIVGDEILQINERGEVIS
jgi:hypothetical protein